MGKSEKFMKLKTFVKGFVSLGAIALATPVQAQAPGIYYSWRSLTTDLTQCLVRSEAALAETELAGIVVDGNSVSGRTETATALFICLENVEAVEEVTVMLIVSSDDEDAAIVLREALKENF